MTRTQLFGSLMILVLLGLGGAFVAQRYLNNQPLTGQVPNPPLPIRILAPPAISPWVQVGAQRFNNSQRPVGSYTAQVTVDTQPTLAAIDSLQRRSLAQPEAWIVDSSLLIPLVNDQLGPYLDAGSARTLATAYPVWAFYKTRADTLQAKFGSLNWHGVHDAAVAPGWESLGGRSEWNFVRLLIPDPQRDATGLLVLAGAAAEYHNRPALTTAEVTDSGFQTWLGDIAEAVPSQVRSQAVSPAETLTTTGGSTADGGQVLDADLVQNAARARTNNDSLIAAYPQFVAVADYTLAVSAAASSDQREAVLQFTDFLLASEQQVDAWQFGLHPAQSVATPAPTPAAKLTALNLTLGSPATTPVTVNAPAVWTGLQRLWATYGR
jgi:hypothetical protein